jgi:hypothetical protein
MLLSKKLDFSGAMPLEQTPNRFLSSIPNLNLEEVNHFDKSFETPYLATPKTAESSPKTEKMIPVVENWDVGMLKRRAIDQNEIDAKRRTSVTTVSISDMSIENGNPNGTPKERERFLEKNRKAASKCREKKKQYISGLEESVSKLTKENARLKKELENAQNELGFLRAQADLN